MTQPSSTPAPTPLLPTNIDIGVIGGTGVYGVEGMVNRVEYDHVETPFGRTSSKVVVGELPCGERVAFISRHDTCHRFCPAEVPFRANIYALKMMGVKYLLTFGAVGSLRQECKPLDVVVPDQFIDLTKSRGKESTFFGSGVVAHVSFGEPVCAKFSKLIAQSISELQLEGVTVHDKGTYVCMEGPAFSTRAESLMYRTLGGTVIGMTAVQEAKLAREAEMAYGLVSFVTDFDSWHDGHDQVTVDMVIKTLKQNGVNAQVILKKVIENLKEQRDALGESAAHSALRFAIMTRDEHIPAETKKNLAPIISKYVK